MQQDLFLNSISALARFTVNTDSVYNHYKTTLYEMLNSLHGIITKKAKILVVIFFEKLTWQHVPVYEIKHLHYLI